MAKDFGGLENILRNAARKGEETKGMIVKDLPLSQIVENENNFFSMEEDAEFLSLVESIKEIGVLHPILVHKIEDPNEADQSIYRIIAGHRMYRASIKAGKKTVPAVIAKFDDSDQAEIAMLDANFTTRVLTPADIAAFIKHYEQIIKDGTIKGRKRDYIGKKLGLSGQQVERYKAYGALDPEVQKMIDEEKIALTAAPYLKQLPPEEQKEAAQEIINTNAPDTRKAAIDIVSRKKQKAKADPAESTMSTDSKPENAAKSDPDPIEERISQLNKAITDFVNHIKKIDNSEAIKIIEEAIKILKTLKTSDISDL